MTCRKPTIDCGGCSLKQIREHHRLEEAAASATIRRKCDAAELVGEGTGEYQLTFDAVLDDMMSERRRELNLRAVGSGAKS